MQRRTESHTQLWSVSLGIASVSTERPAPETASLCRRPSDRSCLEVVASRSPLASSTSLVVSGASPRLWRHSVSRPGVVGVGGGVPLTVQSGLARRAHLPVLATLTVSLIASVIGLLGARIYYLAEQGRRLPGKPRRLLTAGMCIQGFVVAAIAAATIGMLVTGIPLGRYLDVT